MAFTSADVEEAGLLLAAARPPGERLPSPYWYAREVLAQQDLEASEIRLGLETITPYEEVDEWLATLLDISFPG